MISIKMHDSYRRVVAVADVSIIGKKFEQGVKQLDVRENFYKGTEYDLEQAIKQLQRHFVEDATFNIVGEESVKAAISAGIINSNSTSKIANIPFALKLI